MHAGNAGLIARAEAGHRLEDADALRLAGEDDLAALVAAAGRIRDAGFGSVRRFNAAVRRSFDCTPSELRGAKSTRATRERTKSEPTETKRRASVHGDAVAQTRSRPPRPGALRLRLAARPPFDGDAVRFFINTGRNQGANPRRLLAAICRRGDVQGSDIGSIAIHPNASTFDVRKDVAEQFEKLAEEFAYDKQMLVGRLDAVKYAGTAKSEGISGYPTIKLYRPPKVRLPTFTRICVFYLHLFVNS